MRTTRLLATSAAALLALTTLAACGDDGEDTGSAPTTPATTATTTSEGTASPTGAGSGADCPAFEGVPAVPGDVGEAPEIGKPEGDPPTGLKTQDCLVGTGEEVDDLTTYYDWNYAGVNWSNGEQFDSSFERGVPATFALSQVIPGWQDGLQGMKVGGRRMLVIPPDQAYGAAGRPGIPANETLVFVVDLVGATEDAS